MEQTINYILIEDRKNIWEDYQYMLDDKFSNLKPHKRSRYIESFRDMEDNLYAAIIDGNLDLIISDISLSFDTSDKNTFISQLLKNIFDRLNYTQKKAIVHKGMGLILVTQFPEDNLATIIGEDMAFLNTSFKGWSFLKKEDFSTRIAAAITHFRTNFTSTSNGWYHNDHLDTHFHNNNFAEIHFYLRDGPKITLRGQDIIAITTEILYYFDQNEAGQKIVQQIAHEKDFETFLQETNTMPILDGRDPDNHFYDTAIVYFLPIRNRRNGTPETIINATHKWRRQGRNRGRTLILDEDRTIRFDCSFSILNTFIDKQYPRLNH